MNIITIFDSKPEAVEIDNLPDGAQFIKLRRKIQVKDISADPAMDQQTQTKWQAEEVSFFIRDRNLTSEDVISGFDDWWIYGIAWTPETGVEPSMLERLRALEDAFLSIIGGNEYV